MMELSKSIEEIWNRLHSTNDLINLTNDWKRVMEEVDILQSFEYGSEELLFLILTTQWYVLTSNHQFEERLDFFDRHDQIFSDKLNEPIYKLWLLSINYIMRSEMDNGYLFLEGMDRVIYQVAHMPDDLDIPISFDRIAFNDVMMVLSKCYHQAFKYTSYTDAESCLKAQLTLTKGHNYNKDEFLLLKYVQFQLFMTVLKYSDALVTLKDTLSTCGANSSNISTSLRAASFSLKRHLTALDPRSIVASELIKIWNFILDSSIQSASQSKVFDNADCLPLELESKITIFLKEMNNQSKHNSAVDLVISKISKSNPEIF